MKKITAVMLSILAAGFLTCSSQMTACRVQAASDDNTASLDAAQATSAEVADDALKDRIAQMSIEEKAAQLFFVRCPKKDALSEEQKYQFGGYIFFASDFKDQTPQSIRQQIASLQAAADIPMLMGVDEEGGTVNRISKYQAFRSQPFASPRTLYAAGGLAQVQADTTEKCTFLLNLGINVNFAPVCDVSQKPGSFMYARSLGQNADVTAEYVRSVVQVMKEQKVGSTLKHFPGYGENADTHTGIATDNRSLASFRQSDFLPFQAGIQAGADMVLVSHNIVTCMDADKPASLSPQVHQILRQELGFQGVIITDDLVMEAVQQYTGEEGAAVDAVLAGNDMLCCTNYQTQLPAVIAAMKSGEISEAQVDASLLRILKWKRQLGLLTK